MQTKIDELGKWVEYLANKVEFVSCEIEFLEQEIEKKVEWDRRLSGKLDERKQ